MFIPGEDLLDLALSVIDAQEVQLHAFVSATVGTAGVQVSTYADPIGIEGSMQSVDQKRLMELGVDRSKKYMVLWTSYPVQTVERDINGDHIEYAGALFLASSGLDWMPQDGWNAVLCVAIPAVRKPLPSGIY